METGDGLGMVIAGGGFELDACGCSAVGSPTPTAPSGAGITTGTGFGLANSVLSSMPNTLPAGLYVTDAEAPRIAVLALQVARGVIHLRGGVGGYAK